jgi:hypothetical protein
VVCDRDREQNDMYMSSNDNTNLMCLFIVVQTDIQEMEKKERQDEEIVHQNVGL